MQDLLGENFRRQMLMDGQYGSITFICTKTDVIQVRPPSVQAYAALASYVPCSHQCTERELHGSTLCFTSVSVSGCITSLLQYSCVTLKHG